MAVKTFVLSLGAGLGLMIAVLGAFDGENDGAAGAWHASTCNEDFVKEKWWRIPLYLACSVFVLGQYRLPIVQYWRALIVQLVAYEVQYKVFDKMRQAHVKDHLDTATSNMVGAAAGVIAAGLITLMVDVSGDFYRARLLQESSSNNKRLGNVYFRFLSTLQKANYYFGIGRQSDVMKLELKKKLKEMRKELKDPNHPRQQIEFPPNEENALLEAIVGTQDINLWSILMPAVYQLVPGSIIAKLWFSALFYVNPYLDENDEKQVSQESVFANLMVISTSLALGLVIGFALFQVGVFIVGRCFCRKEEKEDNEDNFHITQDYIANKQGMMEGMYTVVHDDNDDPDSMRLLRETGSSELCTNGTSAYSVDFSANVDNVVDNVSPTKLN